MTCLTIYDDSFFFSDFIRYHGNESDICTPLEHKSFMRNIKILEMYPYYMRIEKSLEDQYFDDIDMRLVRLYKSINPKMSKTEILDYLEERNAIIKKYESNPSPDENSVSIYEIARENRMDSLLQRLENMKMSTQKRIDSKKDEKPNPKQDKKQEEGKLKTKGYKTCKFFVDGDAFECPVCFEVPQVINGPINQCHFGHFVCQKCEKKLDICPVCKSSLICTRNLFLEKVLRAMQEQV